MPRAVKSFVLSLALLAGTDVAGAQLSATPGAPAHGPVSQITQAMWSFDETTSGGDVLWTSPTSVESNAVLFEATTALTTIEVTVTFLGIPFTVDVTDEVPPDVQQTEGSILGPAPITLFDEPFVFPEPPEPTSVAADVTIGLDATGTGFFSATNVTLGTATVDLGIFGVQTVDIDSIRIVGQIAVTTRQFLDLGAALAGTNGAATLAGNGCLEGNDPLSLTIGNALGGSLVSLVIGFGELNAPFKGGLLVPTIDVLIAGLPVDGAGNLTLFGTWPAGVPSDFELRYQVWFADPGGVAGFASTNALLSRTP